MRVLLDECLPRRLKRELTGHDVRTAAEMGWAGKSNGALLELLKDEFDVFVTVDKNLPAQQAHRYPQLSFILLKVSKNRFREIVPIIPLLRAAIEKSKPGQFQRIP